MGSGEPGSYLTLEAGTDVVSSDGGVEDSESTLEHKLHRAWEIVSGRG
jgi:hypothetical protein